MTTEVTMDDVRPPEEEIVRERDEHGNKARWISSISDLNQKVNFAIVYYRHSDGDDGGIVEILEPEFNEIIYRPPSEDLYYETWQEAEEHIHENYEQPDAPNELIQPIEAGIVEVEVAEIRLRGEDGRCYYLGEIPGGASNDR